MNPRAILPIVLATAAAAEPIVVRFPNETYEAELNLVDARLPAIHLRTAYSPYTQFGLPFTLLTPGPFLDFVDAEGLPTCTFGVQGYTPGVFDDYSPIVFCFSPEFHYSLFRFEFNFPICNDCDLTGAEFTIPEERFGPFLLPIRVGEGLSSPSWNHGWVAYEYVAFSSPDCPPTTCEVESQYARVEFIAFGYETDADVPIAPGGGLCRADLNLDALIDLADITAFASAFIGQQPDADFTADGLFDLADIVGFVTAFEAGCDLGVLPERR